MQNVSCRMFAAPQPHDRRVRGSLQGRPQDRRRDGDCHVWPREAQALSAEGMPWYGKVLAMLYIYLFEYRYKRLHFVIHWRIYDGNCCQRSLYTTVWEPSSFWEWMFPTEGMQWCGKVLVHISLRTDIRLFIFLPVTDLQWELLWKKRILRNSSWRERMHAIFLSGRKTTSDVIFNRIYSWFLWSSGSNNPKQA